MAIGAFPLAKLGALLLKQISKPLANAVKNRAKTHPTFRTYVCMPPAQFYNWCEVQFKMWLLNLGKPVEVPKLNENQAIELGANILGEGIIFAIAAAILIAEYMRQVKKEAAKEEAKSEEMASIKRSINDMFFENQKNGAEIKELMRHVNYLETQLKKFPPPQPSPAPVIEKPIPFDETKDKDLAPKELAPTNINYFHKQNNSTKQQHTYQNILRTNKTRQDETQVLVNNNSILSAVSFLEDELLSRKYDTYIEEDTNGVMMDALEYLDSDVFKTSAENNVILVLRNAPYSSRFC